VFSQPWRAAVPQPSSPSLQLEPDDADHDQGDTAQAHGPEFLADPDPALRRVHPPLPGMASALWRLTHPDLRRVARVRALPDFTAARLVLQRPLLKSRLRP
jgi:hypothetical protein